MKVVVEDGGERKYKKLQKKAEEITEREWRFRVCPYW